MTVAQASCLNVCLSPDGTVTYARTSDPAITDSGLGPAEFFNFARDFERPIIRIAGNRTNAPLVVEASKRRDADEVADVLLCSPGIGQSFNERNDPTALIQRMSMPYELPASLGGWHRLEDADLLSYQLAMDLDYRTHDSSERLLDLLAEHPAYTAMSFIRPAGLNIRAACEFIALVLDPRWFVDTRRPDRDSRLRSFLGLDPATHRYVSGCGPRTRYVRHATRCNTVYSMWRLAKPYTGFDGTEPCFYFHHLWAQQRGDDLAGLRASQLLVEFIRSVWLDELVRDSRRTTDALFIPQFFFPESVAKAFLRHRKALRGY